MVNPINDYEQNKLRSNTTQTVIIDETETGETDELDPNFQSDGDPDSEPDSPELDGEGIDESKAGLNNDADDTGRTSMDDPGLNHSTEDDLSLNTPDNDIL
jgi:hypothetical protein